MQIGQVPIFIFAEHEHHKTMQLKKAAKYSLAVGLVVPAFSAIVYLVALAPAPIAFGEIHGLLTFPVNSFTTSPMITSKAQMLQVMKKCDANGADTLTREQKFQVFVRVCDNMLAEGRISKANHTRWTNIW